MIIDLSRDDLADVVAALHTARNEACSQPEADRFADIRDRLYERLHDQHPEPMFVIKARDALGPAAITSYRAECARHGLTDQQYQVSLALVELCSWQVEHPTRVHLPDHKHRPVDA